MTDKSLHLPGVDPVPYDVNNLPSPQQIDELLKQRRTTRFFTKDRIDRELLEEIIGYTGAGQD
jgi:hypothetical protein